MTAEQTELDVLRMAAETRAGHTSVVASTMLSLLSILLALVAVVTIAFNSSWVLKASWLWIVFLGVISLFNFFFGWFAWRRLNSALRHKRAEQRVVPSSDAQTLPGTEATALPPGRMSVTEGTTELLNPRQGEQEAVPIKRGSGNTSAIN